MTTDQSGAISQETVEQLPAEPAGGRVGAEATTGRTPGAGNAAERGESAASAAAAPAEARTPEPARAGDTAAKERAPGRAGDTAPAAEPATGTDTDTREEADAGENGDSRKDAGTDADKGGATRKEADTDTGTDGNGNGNGNGNGEKADAGMDDDGARGDGKESDKQDDKDGKDGDKPADGDKPDPWQAFGPAPELVPGRVRRSLRAVGRFLIHEWTLAVLASLALAVALTWPALRYPLYTLPQDYWDPSLQAWQMAWSGHILLTDPAQLWQSNTFFPEPWSFAFSDTLLGYAPAGMIGSGPEAAVLRYNIMFVLAHALATLGAYALARQLGASRAGAAVAGASYTYAPWLLAQAGHLHVVSNGGIPLALAMLARGHGWSLRHGYRPERRHAGWAGAGWLVAAWQLSLGFGVGLPFAYVLAGATVVAAVVWFVRRWSGRRPFGVRLLLADVLGAALFAGVGALLAVPYFKVAELHPNAARTLGDITVYSPPFWGFFTAPAESRAWGSLHEGARSALPWPPEMTLLPGFVLYALAVGGLFFSVWRVWHRLLLLAGVLVTAVLAMGTRFFGGTYTYGLLFEYLPGWNGLRTPGRMMLWTTLLLGLLAAGAVSAFALRVRELAAERVPPWPGPWLRLATVLPLLLVIAEGLNTTPHPAVPAQPAAMRLVDGPLLVLPSAQNLDQPVMLWSTSRFQDVVNGGSGFTPARQAEIRQVTESFPSQESVTYLRDLGVRNVVVLRDQIADTLWETTVDAPVEELGITRQEIDGAVVFHLSS